MNFTFIVTFTVSFLTVYCGFPIAPAHGGTFNSIASFNGGNDGASPYSSLIEVGNKLYGTTIEGGGSSKCAGGCGTVFWLDPTTGVRQVVYAFQGGTDGAMPFGNLIYVGGILYGTSNYGGSSNCYDGCGVIFSIDPATGLEKITYAFQGLSDGRYPSPGLVAVGTTLYGSDANGYGQVFSLNTATDIIKVVYSFGGGSDGAMPSAPLIKIGEKLFGTTVSGGGSDNCSGGCGTVFSLSLKTGIEKIIYAFQGANDGAGPFGSLTNVGGTLFGTTSNGGLASSSCDGGCGTVFSINAADGGESIVYALKGGMDGSGPSGNLTVVGGILYGTTIYGGASNFGVVLSLNLKSHVEQVVHTFQGGTSGFDGANPTGGLVKIGKLIYGTTSSGGSGYGTIFTYAP